MADFNFVLLTGISTKTPAIRRKAEDQMKAEFSFEVERPFVRPDGVAVSDLFLVDAWGPLANWTAEYVRVGTRMLVIGTLNKESYRTRGGTKEHITVVKAKHIELLDDAGPAEDLTEEDLREDEWDVPDIVRHLRGFTEHLDDAPDE